MPHVISLRLRALCLVALSGAPLLPSCACDEELGAIPGDLLGHACDVDTGQPLVSKSLTLEAGSRVHEALSGADGSFTFQGVTTGAVKLHLPAGELGGAERVISLSVSTGATTTFDDTACRAPPDVPGDGSVDGQICNRHTGALVSGAQVIVAGATSVWRTSTDAEGRFLLEHLPRGEHVLTVGGEGFSRAFLIEIENGETTHLELGEDCTETSASLGSLSGSLCDASDPTGALIGAVVSATDATGNTISDVTDTEGLFFLNALAPGPATVSVVRDDVNDVYSLDVVAGEDRIVARQLSCREQDLTCSYEVVGSPVIDQRPVDIIFVVDDSGSMDDDNDAVRNSINAFSSSIQAAGIDHHVVLVGTTNVQAPLGGSARFRHVDTNVDSNDPLIKLVETYGSYAGFLRENSVKHFVAITDDESDMSAGQFQNTVASWPGFAGYTFHSIVAYGNDPDQGCSTGAAYGHEYMNLSATTGGLTSPICNANYSSVFSAVVAAVVTVSLPCTLPLAAPAGQTADPTRVTVSYAGTSLPALGSCTGPGWRFDPGTSSIVACPETCAVLAADDGNGLVVASVGCFQ